MHNKLETSFLTLAKENSEVMMFKTIQDIKHWEELDEVDYVEKDHKVYLQQTNNYSK